MTGPPIGALRVAFMASPVQEIERRPQRKEKDKELAGCHGLCHEVDRMNF